MDFVPYASAPIACAPPMPSTRSTPASAAAASTSGLGFGLAMMTSRTPATFAGTAFIRTDDG